jgi:hypothetical protein
MAVRIAPPIRCFFRRLCLEPRAWVLFEPAGQFLSDGRSQPLRRDEVMEAEGGGNDDTLIEAHFDGERGRCAGHN